jgi:hypothetical protein
MREPVTTISSGFWPEAAGCSCALTDWNATSEDATAIAIAVSCNGC